MALVSPVSADILSAEIERVALSPKCKEAVVDALNDLRHSLVSLHTMLGDLSMMLFAEKSEHDDQLKKLQQQAESLRGKIAAIKPSPSEPECVLNQLFEAGIFYQQRVRLGLQGKRLTELERIELHKATQENCGVARNRGDESLAEFNRKELEQSSLRAKEEAIRKKSNKVKLLTETIEVINSLVGHIAQVADIQIVAADSNYHAGFLYRVNAFIGHIDFLPTFGKIGHLPVKELGVVSRKLNDIMSKIEIIEAMAQKVHDKLPADRAPATKTCLGEMATVIRELRATIMTNLKSASTRKASPSRPIGESVVGIQFPGAQASAL